MVVLLVLGTMSITALIRLGWSRSAYNLSLSALLIALTVMYSCVLFYKGVDSDTTYTLYTDTIGTMHLVDSVLVDVKVEERFEWSNMLGYVRKIDTTYVVRDAINYN